MAEPSPTTTFRRNPLSTWCFDSEAVATLEMALNQVEVVRMVLHHHPAAPLFAMGVGAHDASNPDQHAHADRMAPMLSHTHGITFELFVFSFTGNKAMRT